MAKSTVHFKSIPSTGDYGVYVKEGRKFQRKGIIYRLHPQRNKYYFSSDTSFMLWGSESLNLIGKAMDFISNGGFISTKKYFRV